ncbi:MAG: molybdate ABC transporter permease subunit [Coriobacteriia bacterium]|nr:molybdate ABC transporter permease subunit [Coriobacteriia bacterium]MBS5477791.1 molybdate ABC transporter permease subunit [Coriobacteriia bacterium]
MPTALLEPASAPRRARLCVLVLFALAWALCLCLALPSPALGDDSGREQELVEGSAADTAAGLGINDFGRLNKGTGRAYEGQDFGYRFPVNDPTAVVAFVMSDEIVVFVPSDAAQAAGFDASDTADVSALTSMFASLDEQFSNGGSLMGEVGVEPVVVVGESSYTSGARTYQVNVEIGDGYTYATITRSDDIAPKEGLVCLDYGHLVALEGVATQDVPTWWEELGAFLAGIDYRPLWVSLKTSAAALVVVFVLGLLAAWKSIGVKSRWKGVVDSLFTIPMVLPPTVCGFLLLLAFGNSTEFGRWLMAHGIELVFSWPAAVIAATVVSFPLMYRTARGAFEALDPNMLDAARTLGWSNLRIFLRLMVPLAWPSIAAGTVLAFARAMGEFGATLFVAGNYAGITQTMPIAIYFQWMGGNTDVALFWVVVVIIISFLVILLINVYSSHSQRYRSSGRLTRSERKQIERERAQRGELHAGAGHVPETTTSSASASKSEEGSR